MRRRLAAVLISSACSGPTVTMSIDAPLVDTPDDPSAGWSAAMPLAELDSDSIETDPTISADGLDIVFSSNRPGGMGLTDLYRASRASIDEPFGPPVLVAELNTPGSDQAAELAGDGLTIYLRQPGAMSADIYTSHRPTRSGTFDTLVYEPQLSSAEVETNPGIARDNLTFSSTREIGTNRELYIQERGSPTGMWGAARLIQELSSPGNESGAAFGQTGLVIFFHADRDSPMADVNDIYVATRPSKTEPFGTPIRLTTLSTDANESDPSVTADLRYIVFECASDLCYARR